MKPVSLRVCVGSALALLFGTILSVFIAELCLRLGNVFAPVSVFANVRELSVRDRQTDWDVEYRFNSSGFRGTELPMGSQSVRRPIVVLGDSFVFGQGVSEDEAFPKVLQDELLAHGIDLQVVNLGLIGVGPEAYHLVFRDVGLSLKPSVTVLTVFGNDASSNYEPSAFRLWLRSLAHHWHLFAMPRVLHQRIAAQRGRDLTNSAESFWLALSSRCVQFHSADKCRAFVETFTARFGREINNLAAACLSDPLEVARWVYTDPQSSGWRDFRRYVTKIRDLAVAENSKLILAVVADGPQVDADQLDLRRQLGVAYGDDVLSEPGRFQQLVHGLGVELGIPVFDSVTGFRGSAGKLFFASDLHWNARGHRVFAGDLAQFLIDGQHVD